MPRANTIITGSEIKSPAHLMELPSQRVMLRTSAFDYRSWTVLSLSALPTTLTDESAIAAAAMTGESMRPKAG